ncbi:MAG: hypothetical protein DRR19_17170 [Candidatus Parabeggiatoa sp. nov. 1]|nr:MAG: hypothetical protein DRR19_17170 [Gammaproteobacteria bacterium]
MFAITEPSSLTQARCSAIEYLARREHASLELRNKLARKGFEQSVIDCVLIQLRADKLLSDERFVECFVRSKTNKGYGPLRIQQELKRRGIGREMLTNVLDAGDSAWLKRARLAQEKRFRDLPQNQREQAKQFRFLQHRGFTCSQIQAALSSDKDD